MYKLVAVDLDGTLLDDNKEIDEATLDTINEAINKGTYFVFASGRPVITQMRFYDKIKQNMPIIACNGGIIAYPYENKIIKNIVFKKEELKYLVEYFNKMNKSFIAWEASTLYANTLNEYTTSYHDACKHANVSVNVIDDYDKFYSLNINKLIVIDESDNIQAFLQDVKKEVKRKCNYFTSQSYFLEFVPACIDKGKALASLAKYLGIKKKEIIAIGDGHNDLPMIKYAHLGVSLENASEYVKKKAKYITSDNNHQGVKKVLEKYVLGDNHEKR